jgi:Ca2+-binding EF-hand superfamily protein
MRNTRRIGVVMLLCGLPVAHGQTANDSTRANGTQAVTQAATQAVIDGRVFQRLDANGDGRLTREEARIDAVVAAAFERIDVDGDGIVSRAEARQFDERREPAQRAPANESVR